MIPTLRTGFVAALVCLCGLAAPVSAADRDRGPVLAVAASAAAVTTALPSVPMAGAVTLVPIELTAPVMLPFERQQPAFSAPARSRVRGTLLPSLYVSLAGLNAFDAYTTTVGVSTGATEANPVMRGVAGNPAAMWAVKGGVTAASIYMAERLWKKNRKVEAITVMAITNGMMAVVAARNAAVLNGR